MKEIDLKKVTENYNSIENIWQSEDKWHLYNHRKINQFIGRVYKHTSHSGKILNAGSGGQSYCLPEDNMVHIDIVSKNIKSKAKQVTADIQSIPLEDSSFDLILCVGEVINYCDALLAISELSRVLKIGGELILEFESSKTLELIFKDEFNASSIITDTFYQGRAERIWYFSEDYITSSLKAYGFEVQRIERFHIISILIYRFTKSWNFAARFAKLDLVFRWIPWIRMCASNVILIAKKVR